MKYNILKDIPIPISGLMLGLASLSMPIKPWSMILSRVTLLISVFLLCILLLKILGDTKSFFAQIKNHIILSVFSTFPMALSIIALNLQQWIGFLSVVLWYASLIIHFLIIIAFTLEYRFNFQVKNVHASFFIVYVGPAIYVITSIKIGNLILGQYMFYFTLLMAVLLFAIVSLSHRNKEYDHEHLKPLVTIYAAPFALLLTSYFSFFTEKNMSISIFLTISMCVNYIFSLTKLLSYIKGKFYPSHSSFTFPYVISAIAFGWLTKYNSYFAITKYFSLILAIILTYLVLIRYIIFMYNKYSKYVKSWGNSHGV